MLLRKIPTELGLDTPEMFAKFLFYTFGTLKQLSSGRFFREYLKCYN